MKTKGGRKLKLVNETPLNAARRAYSVMCQGKGEGCKMAFTLQETTQGSSKKEYSYYGKKKKLPKKIVRKIGKTTITSEYSIDVKRVDEK